MPEPPFTLTHLQCAPMWNDRITVGRRDMGRVSRKPNSAFKIKTSGCGTPFAIHPDREERFRLTLLSLSARVPGSRELTGPRADGLARMRDSTEG